MPDRPLGGWAAGDTKDLITFIGLSTNKINKKPPEETAMYGSPGVQAPRKQDMHSGPAMNVLNMWVVQNMWGVLFFQTDKNVSIITLQNKIIGRVY